MELRQIAPRQCAADGNLAYWEVTTPDGNSAVCHECMFTMARMNSDNEAFFKPALEQMPAQEQEK